MEQALGANVVQDDKKDAGAGPGFALEASVSHLLHRAQQLAAERFGQLTDATLTLRQFAVLAAVAERPDRTQTDLVRITGIDRSTLADLIARMEKRGLLARETAARDGRAKAVRLTPKGEARIEAAEASARAADDAVLGLVPKARRKAFLETLQALARAADALEDPAADEQGKPGKRKKKAAKAERPTKAEKPEKAARKAARKLSSKKKARKLKR